MIEIAASAGLFILVWVILSKSVFTPYLEVLQERESRTIGDERAAEDLIKETTRLDAEIAEELREASLQGIKIRDSHINEAKGEAQALTDQASARANAELDAARAEIASMVEAARTEMNVEAGELAGSMVERLLEADNSARVVH